MHRVMWESAAEDAARAVCLTCGFGLSGELEAVTAWADRHEAEERAADVASDTYSFMAVRRADGSVVVSDSCGGGLHLPGPEEDEIAAYIRANAGWIAGAIVQDLAEA